MNPTEIKQAIQDNNFYSLESMRAWAMLAAEIRGVKDSEARQELTSQFEAMFGRKVAVWARIMQRFSAVIDSVQTRDGWLSLSYLCQLPEDKCLELYAAHSDHIDEPNAHLFILSEVNATKPRRERPEKHCPHCGAVL